MPCSEARKYWFEDKSQAEEFARHKGKGYKVFYSKAGFIANPDAKYFVKEA